MRKKKDFDFFLNSRPGNKDFMKILAAVKARGLISFFCI